MLLVHKHITLLCLKIISLSKNLSMKFFCDFMHNRLTNLGASLILYITDN